LAAVNACPLLLLVNALCHMWQQAQSPCRQRSLSHGCQHHYTCEQKGCTTRGEYAIVCYSGKRNSSRVVWRESVKRLLSVASVQRSVSEVLKKGSDP